MDLKEIQDIVKNVAHYRERLYTVPFASTAINGNAIGGVVPYKNWRVVAVGFNVTVGGVSTQNPQVEFGVLASDTGATDDDYFGSVFQSANEGEQFVAGEMYIYDPLDKIVAHSVYPAESVPVWDDGAGGLLVWQTTAGVLRLTRPNDHQLTVVGFAVVEVKEI